MPEILVRSHLNKIAASLWLPSITQDGRIAYALIAAGERLSAAI